MRDDVAVWINNADLRYRTRHKFSLPPRFTKHVFRAEHRRCCVILALKQRRFRAGRREPASDTRKRAHAPRSPVARSVRGDGGPDRLLEDALVLSAATR